MSDARERDRPAGSAQARAGSASETIQREQGIVGRDDELDLALAVLQTGRHLLFEGTVGVGKTRVALAVCAHLGRTTAARRRRRPLLRSQAHRLVRPAARDEQGLLRGDVLRGAARPRHEGRRRPVRQRAQPHAGRRPERAAAGARRGAPRAAAHRRGPAAPGFQVIATQNPAEYIATGHLSEALRDRFEHVSLGYQSAAEEALIVRAGDARATTSCSSGGPSP